jgi:hypothetical protein
LRRNNAKYHQNWNFNGVTPDILIVHNFNRLL